MHSWFSCCCPILYTSAVLLPHGAILLLSGCRITTVLSCCPVLVPVLLSYYPSDVLFFPCWPVTLCCPVIPMLSWISNFFYNTVFIILFIRLFYNFFYTAFFLMDFFYKDFFIIIFLCSIFL